MRIGLFSWESLHSLAVGGVAAHVTELAAGLERLGHEVHVFTRIGHDQPHYSLIHGVHYHRCSFPMNSNFADEIDNMCRAFVDAAFGVEDQLGPFDIIHGHDWLACNALAWIKQGRGRKAVLTMHSTEYGRNGNNHYGGQSSRVAHNEWFGTYSADRVITVSHYLKYEIQQLYQVPDDKCSVIYNGVNPEQFDYPLDPGAIKSQYGIHPFAPVILFVGRLVVQKGPDILLEAIGPLLHFHPTAKFLFVGDGHMRRYLEEMAQHRGISHAIRFLGDRRGRDLYDLFKACDIVAVPSRNEPFGIVILEAWSAGKPVVSTKRGGPAEFVWHEVNGLQVDDNPDSLGWGIGTLLADPPHGLWLGKNGRQTVDSAFKWDHIATQVEQVYATLH